MILASTVRQKINWNQTNTKTKNIVLNFYAKKIIQENYFCSPSNKKIFLAKNLEKYFFHFFASKQTEGWKYGRRPQNSIVTICAAQQFVSKRWETKKNIQKYFIFLFLLFFFIFLHSKMLFYLCVAFWKHFSFLLVFYRSVSLFQRKKYFFPHFCLWPCLFFLNLNFV